MSYNINKWKKTITGRFINHPITVVLIILSKHFDFPLNIHNQPFIFARFVINHNKLKQIKNLWDTYNYTASQMYKLPRQIHFDTGYRMSYTFIV